MLLMVTIVANLILIKSANYCWYLSTFQMILFWSCWSPLITY